MLQVVSRVWAAVGCHALVRDTYAGRFADARVDASWDPAFAHWLATAPPAFPLVCAADPPTTPLAADTVAGIASAWLAMPGATRELWLGNWLELMALQVARKARFVPLLLAQLAGCPAEAGGAREGG
jgi:hypothetical protein